ncbi:hypothetical protein HW423_04595 [Aerococcaceae bacterium INB8]|uniref:Uncharacterized protein n=1 Tax=Ruoffia halotolerans TaxID=2748684 RepID=A0A839A5F9_9LACT|nr:hypothetical protein [Ruoffia halotolerans]MBA5729060.1 hypothetical protein [Ruoffia halotolerans]
MKKIVKYVMLVVSLLFITQTPVSANDNQSYVSDNEESPISHIVFTPNSVQLTINNEAAEAREIILLLSKHTDEALHAQVDPNSESDDLQALQAELGISFNAIEDQLELENNPTVFNVIQQMQDASSGIYSSIDPMGNILFTISNPEIDESVETIRVKLFNEDLIEFTRGEDSTLEYNSYNFVLEE